MCLQYKSYENPAGKGENARNEQFLLYTQCFLPVLKALCHFLQISKLSSSNSFSLEERNICRLGKSYVKNDSVQNNGKTIFFHLCINFISLGNNFKALSVSFLLTSVISDPFTSEMYLQEIWIFSGTFLT